MELFGTSLQSIYLTVLIISGSLTLLYMLFGDVLDGVFEAFDFLNPTLILAFFTFFSASGYIFELVTSLHSILIIVISLLIAFLLDTLLNVFVLIPLSTAEESLVYTEESLKGRIGKIIVSVPEDGFGEVIIEGISGVISKPAASFDNEGIAEGEKVLVIDVKNGVLYVTPHDTEQLLG
ncbi:NfeD family protein [Bacillus spongiae]|uniref:NfeD family protein n=1 Tax=Bacillus spongiae TaxID=2683610 RepID=A0ABU8HHI2_9BACI